MIFSKGDYMDSNGKLSRREFLQVAGATGAAVTLIGFPFRNLKSVAAFERHPPPEIF